MEVKGRGLAGCYWMKTYERSKPTAGREPKHAGRFGSYLFGHDVRRPVLPTEKAVRFAVVDEFFLRAVKLHRAPNAVGDIRQVTERRRHVPFLNLAVQHVVFVGAE